MPLTQLQATGQPVPPGEPDVQRTSFSLDVLGRFVCSTYEEATTNPDFDVVVIGSGMYGSYAAAKIYSESAKPGRTPHSGCCRRYGPNPMNPRNSWLWCLLTTPRTRRSALSSRC